MGYDMYTKDQGEYFRANISGMGLLRSVMEQCGVRPGRSRERELEPVGDGQPRSLAGDLYSCFGSNDGWLVTPKECLHIAERIEEGLDGVGSYGAVRFEVRTVESQRSVAVIPEVETLEGHDREFAREFATYCRKAAGQSGFYVW